MISPNKGLSFGYYHVMPVLCVVRWALYLLQKVRCVLEAHLSKNKKYFLSKVGMRLLPQKDKCSPMIRLRVLFSEF